MEREKMAADNTKTAAALRSQLNQMAAASQVLERNTRDEKGRAYLAVINQSICRMLRIVGRMELSARLSADSPSSFSPRPMELSQQLEFLSQRLSGVLSDIGISFTFHCPDFLQTEADAPLLRQMLLELVSNLALVSTELSLSVTVSEGKLLLSLHGNAPGDANGRPVLPSVLESDEEQASIDLARRIAELHGGSLMISPAEDGSLLMTISIPHRKGTSLHLETPSAPWRFGGFDPVLVSMSQLLPSRSFLPENLG
jgi:signal transduction histidine kinase